MKETDFLESLSKVQRKVASLFLNGGKYSVADICVALHVCDPRSHIRSLRNKGFNIFDEWRQTADGIRYKVYYHTEK